jgi:hypothetical protein
MMKLAVRAFAVAVVIAGAAAASVSSMPSHRNMITSHQAATASLPIPTCGPGMGCSAGQ